MKRTSQVALVALLGLACAVWMGCEGNTGPSGANERPNTRISSAPPEMSDTGYTINIFWYGWDDDGFVDHYEIAWEDTSEWIGPIFANDSLFSVEVSASCCTDPIPAFGIDYQDSVYEQFHTFFVRAVDNAGQPDSTPAFRSFNAKTVAPHTEITKGPENGRRWGTTVRFAWEGSDDDGVVESYRYALVTREQYEWANGVAAITVGEIVAWVDTLTYRPLSTGQPDLNDPVWQDTELDSVVFESLPETLSDPENGFCFVVRAIDDAGATERLLEVGSNGRAFDTATDINGPSIFISSNLAGSWRETTSGEVHEVFGSEGLRFTWRGTPNADTQAEIVGFSYSIDDTTQFANAPFSLNRTMFPEPIPGDSTEQLWRPREGAHALFVRALDDGRFVNELVARIEVFDGPRECGTEERFILVVRDTDVGALTGNNLIPPGVGFDLLEFTLTNYYFDSYNYQVHETDAGNFPPEVNLMNCASSLFWFHTAILGESDASTLDIFHSQGPNSLPSYVAAGGNLFLCGLQPAAGVRYFDEFATGETEFQNFPVIFANTGEGTDYAEHWFKKFLFVSRIVESIGGTRESPSDRLRVARSRVSGYPDLAFDPTSMPEGPALGGFGYYDRQIQLLPGSPAEVIYTLNNTDSAVGIRRLTSPGVNGNVVYLGLSPYFVERPAFRELIHQVLTQFGEFPIPNQ